MWAVDQNIEKQTCYYITLNTVDLVDVFIRPVYKQVVVHTLNHFIDSKGLVVYGWCLMTNHLHLLAQSRPGFEMTDIEQQYCKFTNQKILEAIETEPIARRDWMLKHFRNNGAIIDCSVWQFSGNRVLIDLGNTDKLTEYFDYIHENPVRDRFVDNATDYPYSSARDYNGQQGLVNVTKLSTIEGQLSVSEAFNNNFTAKHIRI